MDDHKLFMSALVGSVNYNLDNEYSDKDYKYFVFPTFDDLYYRKEIGKAKATNGLDYEVHDLRKLSHLLWKANINFIEPLFSQDIRYYVENDNELVTFLKLNKDALATMNLPYLYDACIGMSLNKQKSMIKDNSIGYDTKSAYHAIRVLDFLCRLATFNGDFGKAIYYSLDSDDDKIRRYLYLDVKAGEYELSQIKELLGIFTENVEFVKDWYKEQKPNSTLKEELDEVIKKQCFKFITET